MSKYVVSFPVRGKLVIEVDAANMDDAYEEAYVKVFDQGYGDLRDISPNKLDEPEVKLKR